MSLQCPPWITSSFPLSKTSTTSSSRRPGVWHDHGMTRTVRSFQPDIDLTSLLTLLQRRAQAGLSEPMGEEEFSALAARWGFKAKRDSVVMTGTSVNLVGCIDIYLAVGEKQADLLLAIDAAASDEVREALLDAANEIARESGATS